MSLHQILARFDVPMSLADVALERSVDGLINDTYLLDGYVLQRLHPVFGAEVNRDIRDLVPTLRAHRVPVPLIVDALDGQPWVSVHVGGEFDGIWRLMSRLPGRTIHRVDVPEQAHQAGWMLARFHGALRDTNHVFAFERLGVHDTSKHFRVLDAALMTCRDHRLFSQVEDLAHQLRVRWHAMHIDDALPRRIGHGDPKISNFLLDDSNRVIGVIDLDTMGWTTLDVELGDACRSWCSSANESASHVGFDVALFEAAMHGYLRAARDWLTPGELQSVPTGVQRICLELSARFAADALHEEYFGWDSGQYATRGDHNLARATNQFQLAEAVCTALPAMRAVIQGLT